MGASEEVSHQQFVVGEVLEVPVPRRIQNHGEVLVRGVDVAELQLILGGGSTRKDPNVINDQKKIVLKMVKNRVLNN